MTLPVMVTEVAGFKWNEKTGLFETIIYAPETQKQKIEVIYATPPAVFLEDHAIMGRAIKEFSRATQTANVLQFVVPGELPGGRLTQ